MKTMQNFAAQQLTKKQMNMISGGASRCPAGQSEYVCTATYPTGASVSGRVCADSYLNAKTIAFDILGEYAHMTSFNC